MNARPHEYTFQRYLSAKRTVDDRALNHHVWQTLHTELAKRAHIHLPLTILEIGGGIGTMVERLLEEDRLAPTSYHLLDEQAENISVAYSRLAHSFGSTAKEVSAAYPFAVQPTHRQTLQGVSGTPHELSLYTSELYDFLTTAGSLENVDLVLAHAFLDLVDIPATLPRFTATLRPNALFYATINFDGATILEPAIDRAYDRHIEQIYHRTMDERVTNGKLSGDSQTGRHLFHHLKAAHIQPLDAGSSDWVIIPHRGVYPHDEAYFLHFIINTMHGALAGHPDLDTQQFRRWIEKRHAQIERGELVYIAHQLDYLGIYDPQA